LIGLENRRDRVAFSSEGRFTGESSRRWRLRGGGTFLGCGDGRICGWSEWLLLEERTEERGKE
jgi:hypothetical protein